MSRIAHLVAAVFVACSTGQCAAVELQIAIEPEEVTIHSLDPIFVRVVLKNDSEELAESAHDLTAESGALTFEVRGPGEDEFRRIPSLFEGGGGVALRKRVQIRPRATRIAHAILCETANRRFFEMRGKYELRCRIVHDTCSGLSPPITVTVNSLGAVVGEELVQANKYILRAIAPALQANDVSSKSLNAIAGLAEGSGLRRTRAVLSSVARVREANTMNSYRDAMTQFEEICDVLPSVERDWAIIILAHTFAEMRQDNSALNTIGTLPEESIERERIDRLIRDRRRETLIRPASPM